MDIKTVCSCVLVLSLQFVCGQYSTTPCPGVFDFEDDGHHVYGKITLQPTSPVSSLVLRINFTVAAQLYSNYVGRLDAHDSTHLLQKYNAGQPVIYLVHFPVTSPLPKLTALTANGDTICYGPGDIAAPNTYVTTLSLQHTSFLERSPPGYNNFQHKPQIRPQTSRPRPQYQHPIQQQPVHTAVNHVHYGEDEATAHIHTLDNIEPAWNTGTSSPQPQAPVQTAVNHVHYGEDDATANIHTFNNIEPIWNTKRPTQQYQPQTHRIFHSRPTYVYDEPAVHVPGPRPVRPPVQPEPSPTRPVYEPVQPPSVSPSPNRFSNGPGPSIECGVIFGGNNRIPLIYNGDAYDRGELPWLVAIYKTDQATLRFICGGTLVSDRHIISAGHCMQRRGSLTSIKDIVVKVGVHNLNDWSDDVTVTRGLQGASFHDEFNSSTLQNDILILTLDKSVTFNQYIRPACLWAGNTDLSVIVGRSGTVAGWGDQGVGGIGKQGEPHKVNIPIVSTNDCRASKSLFHDLTYDNTLCAGDRMGSGPCVGDSGGGMYLYDGGKWRIRGVVSVSLRAENGDPTCNLNEYVVFTDTAQFLPWINRIMARN